MRLHVILMILVCTSLVAVVSAQTLKVVDTGGYRAEEFPSSSWYGSTGLIFVPSASVVPAGKLAGGAHIAQLDSGNQTAFTANISLMSDLEFGVSRINHVQPRGFGSTDFVDKTLFNAKYALELGSWFKIRELPQVAVGVFDASDELNRTFYIVASKKFQIKEGGMFSSFTLHGGFGSTKHDTGALNGVFAGLEFPLFSGAQVQVEWDHAEYNAAFRYFPFQWLSLDAGVIDGNFAYGLSARSLF